MIIRLIIIAVVLAIPLSGFTADHHVRTTFALDGTHGCANNGDGTTWACAEGAGTTGAFNALPNPLTRGDTYYIADGTYSAYSMTAIAGTSVITIKKAVADTHGTVTGWDAELGNGRASWLYGTQNSAFNIYTNYVVFDGVTGSGSDETTYGFKLNFPTDCWGAILFPTVIDSGTSTTIETEGTGVSANGKITDTSKSWAGGAHAGKFIGLIHGGTTKWYLIEANASNWLVTADNHDVVADGFSTGDTYEIRELTGQTILMKLVEISGLDFTDITVKHTSFDGSACGYDYRTMSNQGIKATVYTGKNLSNLVIDYNYFGATNTNLFVNLTDGAIISNNYFASNYTGLGGEVHGQQVVANGSNISFYGNTFKDSTLAAIFPHGGVNSGNKVYNNIFIQSAGHESDANGLIQANGDDGIKGWNVHSNTIIGANMSSYGFFMVRNLTSLDDKSYAYNNLFYNCVSPRMDNPSFTENAITHTNNGYFTSTGTYDSSEGGTAVDSATDPFTNSAGGVYTLAVGSLAIAGGKTLSSPYDTDLNGISRPQGSAWDIGAYEYVSSAMSIGTSAPNITIGTGAANITLQ